MMHERLEQVGEITKARHGEAAEQTVSAEAQEMDVFTETEEDQALMDEQREMDRALTEHGGAHRQEGALGENRIFYSEKPWKSSYKIFPNRS